MRISEEEKDRKVAAALKRLGHPHALELVDFMRDIEVLVLRCAEHGTFLRHAAAFVMKNAGAGRGCPQCHPKRHAIREEVTYAMAVERAAVHGCAPSFTEGDFTDARGRLSWHCIRHPHQVKQMRLCRVPDFRCPECAAERRKERQQARDAAAGEKRAAIARRKRKYRVQRKQQGHATEPARTAVAVQ